MRGLYSLVLGLFLAVSTGTSWAQCRLPQLRSDHQPPTPKLNQRTKPLPRKLLL